ncbi:hypothetical protein IWX47DRAFT_856736 [Phyllosticta citricarpa]
MTRKWQVYSTIAAIGRWICWTLSVAESHKPNLWLKSSPRSSVCLFRCLIVLPTPAEKVMEMLVRPRCCCVWCHGCVGVKRGRWTIPQSPSGAEKVSGLYALYKT